MKPTDRSGPRVDGIAHGKSIRHFGHQPAGLCGGDQVGLPPLRAQTHRTHNGTREKFHAVQAAYALLSDPDKRARYDTEQRAWMARIGQWSACSAAIRAASRDARPRDTRRAAGITAPLAVRDEQIQRAERQAFAHEVARFLDEVAPDLADLAVDGVRRGLGRVRRALGLGPGARGQVTQHRGVHVKSREDKLPPPSYFSMIVAYMQKAHEHARISRELMETLRPYFIEAWRNGKSAEAAAQTTCSCLHGQVVPSPVVGIHLAKGSVRPPKEAQRGEVFGAEALRPPAAVERLMRRLNRLGQEQAKQEQVTARWDRAP